MSGVRYLPNRRTFFHRLDDAAGRLLEGATLGLYQPENSANGANKGRGHMLEKRNGSAIDSLQGDLERPLDEVIAALDEQTLRQLYQLARIQRLGEAVTEHMSNIYVQTNLRAASSLDMVNKLRETVNLTEEQAKRLAALERNYLDGLGGTTHHTYQALLAQVIAHYREQPQVRHRSFIRRLQGR